jgi:hypothetical protein
MTNLKQVNIGFNEFCGPAVLSILTGKNTDECARAITTVSGKYEVEGVKLYHLLMAAEQLGFTNKSYPAGGTLFGVLIRLAKDNGIYIVTVKRHFIVIEVKDGRAYLCDNHTKSPIDAGHSARLQQQVIAINKVFPKPLPKLLETKFRILKTDSAIYIDKDELYEDTRDNKVMRVGRIMALDSDELNRIIEALKEEL